MPSSLPISRLVNVNVNLTPIAASMQNISTLLILGVSTIIDVVTRKRDYNSIDAVAADFGTSAPEYLAALRWFAQSPKPTTLSIGRWAKSASAGELYGAPLSVAQQALANFTAITTGGFEVEIDGIPYSFTGVNLSTAVNLNGVAALIQTAVQIKVPSAIVTWNSVYSRFEVNSPTTGATSSVNFFNAPTSTGNFAFAGQPANNDTITLNGTVVTFVTGAPVGSQVQIGASLTATLAALLTFLNSSVDAQLVKFKYFVSGSTLYLKAATAGAGGDALTIAKSSVNITASGATLSGGTATDISTLLLLTQASTGSYVANGIAAESAATAAALFDNMFGQSWYALVMLSATDADHQAVSAYIEAATNKHIYGITTQDANTLSALSTADLAYLLSQTKPNRTAVQYSSADAYAVCSLLGRILTVNYTGNKTTITLMYKQEPTVTPEYLTATQVNSLEAKNCNVFLAYNNAVAIIEQGKVSSGDFLDTITGTDWLALQIQNSVFNLLYTSPTKIPQTDAGNAIIGATIESVCSQGVANGLLAPGVWNSAGFGAIAQGDLLPKGFYVYAPPIGSQSQADRAARKSVALQVAAKLAGAIHTVDITINVNR